MMRSTKTIQIYSFDDLKEAEQCREDKLKSWNNVRVVSPCYGIYEIHVVTAENGETK